MGLYLHSPIRPHGVAFTQLIRHDLLRLHEEQFARWRRLKCNSAGEVCNAAWPLMLTEQLRHEKGCNAIWEPKWSAKWNYVTTTGEAR
jgi:hypothetical protein